MIFVELTFPVIGHELPEDNGYGLYSAICTALDGHLPKDIGVSSIGGPLLGDWRIRVTSETRLRIRTPVERIPELLPIAGRYLNVNGHEVRLGVPRIGAITPSANLYSRIVTIKGFTEPEPFLVAAERQMKQLGIIARLEIPKVPGGGRRGTPQRRVVKIRRCSIVGYALVVGGLDDESSLILQARGLGGRRHMGCGIFSPFPETRIQTHGI